jgi:signal transduction histidine kinase
VRWTSAVPLIALAGGVLLTLGLLAPLLAVAPYLVPAASVQVIGAADDLRPRRPVEGERVTTLRTANAVNGGAPRQYVAAFDRTAAPSGRIGVLALPTPAKTRVFINGLGLRNEAPSRRGGAFVAEIPRDGLQEGPNRIGIIARAGPYRWPRAIFVGPAAPLRAAAARIAWIERWSLVATGILGAAGALLGFLLVVGKEERLPLVAPSLLALTFAGLAAAAWFEAPSLILTPWVWSQLMLGAVAALIVLPMTGSEKDHWARWVTIGVRACAVATGGVAAAGPISLLAPEAAVVVAHASALLAVLIGAGGGLALTLTGRGVRRAWTPTRRATVALAALALLAAAAAGVTSLGPWGLLFGHALAGISASLFTAAWFGWIAVRAFLDSEDALRRRLSLGQIVREQEARIAAQQAALEHEISLRAVVEERERFSRDIHDGVGGSLTSLLLQARVGGVKDVDLISGLERSLDDLRLMIDALDHAPGALEVAFSTLQTRIAPAFKAAGMRLDWRQENLDGRALNDSRALLQIFRILQEAATNAVRHSGASVVTVRVGWDQDLNALVVEVEDDGLGEGASGQTGHGLHNMTERARRIGGDLTAGPAGDGRGWRVRLQAPGV